MNILFQGDSITDCLRDTADPADLGQGYARIAAGLLRAGHPGIPLTFRNLGVAGSQTADLLARIETDVVQVQPDLVSLLIGINDVWHYADDRRWLPQDVFEGQYRAVLETIRTRTHAKLVVLEPYLLPLPRKAFFREDLDPKIQIIRRLALAYADVFVPTDGLMTAALLGRPQDAFSEDGVHLNDAGAQVLARIYADWVGPVIEAMAQS